MSAETSCGSPADLSVTTRPPGPTSRMRPSDGSISSLNTSRIRVGDVVSVDLAAGSDESSVACMNAGGGAAAASSGASSARRGSVRSKVRDVGSGSAECGVRELRECSRVDLGEG